MQNDLEADHSRIVNHVLAPPAGVFEIDPVHTFPGFSAQHLMVGRVRGHFPAVRGTLRKDIANAIDAEAIRPL
jgi:polyisoprenoid-binding protein YceI